MRAYNPSRHKLLEPMPEPVKFPAPVPEQSTPKAHELMSALTDAIKALREQADTEPEPPKEAPAKHVRAWNFVPEYSDSGRIIRVRAVAQD